MVFWVEIEAHGLLRVFFEDLRDGWWATEHEYGLVDILDDAWVLHRDSGLVRDPVPGSHIVTSPRMRSHSSNCSASGESQTPGTEENEKPNQAALGHKVE